MTAFGSAVKETEDLIAKTEIKSLNSKSFDLRVRMPSKYSEKEIGVHKKLERQLVRGKIDVFIAVKFLKASKIKSDINTNLAIEYFNDLKKITNKIDLKTDNALEIILKMPEVISTPIAMDSINEEWSVIENSILLAIKDLDEFRIKEGILLKSELANYLNEIEQHYNSVDKIKDQRVDRIKEKLEKKIKEITSNFDNERLEQELIFYIEKFDITEEIERLKIHIKHFRDTIDIDNSGKKLNFISQEIGREINTIGSKANDSDIQKHVVSMKNELEKIKQQLSNIL